MQGNLSDLQLVASKKVAGLQNAGRVPTLFNFCYHKSMPKRTTLPQPDTPVEELYNLSDLTGSWLRGVGVRTYKELQNKDLLLLWLELKNKHHQVSKLMYYALWGAVHNQHWNKIPEQEKAKITEFILKIK